MLLLCPYSTPLCRVAGSSIPSISLRRSGRRFGTSRRPFAPGTRANPFRPSILSLNATRENSRRNSISSICFPYPSGAGLHVGHPEGYTATDILARFKRMQGYNVLHPMGWDAFGLPAEQYAIRTGQHPRKTTEENIATFKKQIQSLGFSYDWSREVDTTDPKYFKWSQWIFLKLYNSWFNPATNKAEPIETLPYPAHLTTEEQKREYRDSKRLAYVAETPVNWCPELGTVLANEEVVDGKSEVGGFPVVRKPMRQWMLRITAYAERLLSDLDTINWPDSLKEMQRNWIGRSEGAEVHFQLADRADKITVFTTRPTRSTARPTWSSRPNTNSSPNSPLPNNAPPSRNTNNSPPAKATSNAPNSPRKKPASSPAPTPSTRSTTTASPSGSPTTSSPPTAPARSWPCPPTTSAISNSPANSTFPSRSSCKLPPAKNHSASSASAPASIPAQSPASPPPKQKENHRMARRKRSRAQNDQLQTPRLALQPPALLGRTLPHHLEKDSRGNLYHEALPESALPVLPPDLTDFKPTATGEPPLARAKDWVQLPDGSIRETNTMPQWAGSCWYYLRYLDPKNDQTFADKTREQYWMGTGANSGGDQKTSVKPGVDLYVGGTEHAVLHLLYARFWHKVLFDLGYVSTAEPFYRLVNQGLILGEDGQKMSKSRGNVVNPDDILKRVRRGCASASTKCSWVRSKW